MIEGLLFEFTSAEIAAKYREIAAQGQKQIEGLKKRLAEAEQMTPEAFVEKVESAREMHGPRLHDFGVPPVPDGATIKLATVQSRKRQIEVREEQVERVLLLASHVVKDETFRLRVNDLDFLTGIDYSQSASCGLFSAHDVAEEDERL